MAIDTPVSWRERGGTMRLVAFSLALTFALVAASCRGASTKPSTPTVTQTPKPTASPSPRATRSAEATFTDSIPPVPARIEDYPAAIAAYLNKVGDAALGRHCLADLLAAWHMPVGRGLAPPGTSVGEGRCLLGDTDDDQDKEVIVSLSAVESTNGPLSTDLAVLDPVSNTYKVAYQSLPKDKTAGTPDAILSAGDINNDGAGDLVFAEITCGAHTCNWAVHVVTGTASGYRELTTKDGLMLATADVRIEDTDGNGTKEIIMHGGIIQSAGAGPQRAETDVYAWDGSAYTLKSRRKDPAEARLFKVQDADAGFVAGNYQDASRLYGEAVNDTALKEVGGFGSRDELRAYAMFRLALAELKLGETSAASRQIESAIDSYPISLHGKAAVAFRNAATVTGVGLQDLRAGCQAAIAFINQNLTRFNEIWNFGYGDQEPAPKDICPF